MTKARFVPWLWALLLLAALLAFVFGVEKWYRADSCRQTLERQYEGALSGAVSLMEQAQIKLEKLDVATDEKARAQLLASIGRDASQVQAALSLMPLSHESARDAVKFANQLCDYTDSLILSGDASRERLYPLSVTCGQLADALAGAQSALREGNLSLITEESTFFASADAQQRPMDGISQDIAYPTLVYDGPFSDTRRAGEPRALGDARVTAQEAAAAAKAYIGQTRVADVTPTVETGGAMLAYCFTARLQDGVSLQIAVTKTGGRVLWMSPEHAAFATNTGLEECRAAADAFLSRNGYGGMRANYWQMYDGLAVISYAATQDEVILYPDLVKVQVRMDSAEVVGVEANHYLMNHTARALGSPALSLSQAQARVSSQLSVTAALRCVIPKNGGEKHCYEFTGTYQGQTYLVYINADTGEQEELLKVVHTQNGVLTA